MNKPKLYIKNEKGRYEEYKEPVQEYDNKLYRKVGNKYELCDMLMTSSLSEGVWVVTKQQAQQVLRNWQIPLRKFLVHESKRHSRGIFG